MKYRHATQNGCNSNNFTRLQKNEHGCIVSKGEDSLVGYVAIVCNANLKSVIKLEYIADKKSRYKKTKVKIELRQTRVRNVTNQLQIILHSTHPLRPHFILTTS